MRAGPRTTFAGVTGDTGFPINCARDDSSSNWVWLYADVQAGETTGFPNVTDSDSATPSDGLALSRAGSFYYQATQDFTMTFGYTLTATNGVDFDESSVSVDVLVGGISVFSDTDIGDTADPTASITGSEGINLSATVVPVRVELQTFTAGPAFQPGLCELDIQYSLS